MYDEFGNYHPLTKYKGALTCCSNTVRSTKLKDGGMHHMAIYHCSVSRISRGQGRSAIGASAYRSGDRLRNERDGLIHDYSRKTGIVYTKIITPDNSPEWSKNRNELWNEVERIEKRKDANTAREINIALPNELTREQQINLVQDYAKEAFISKRMVADIAIHDKNDGNPHAHIMITTREINEKGFSNKKITGLDKSENVDIWRKQWSEIANKHLERAGHEIKIDHRSFADQGIEQIPTIHLGPIATAIEKRNRISERGEINREIKRQNEKLKEITQDLKKYQYEYNFELEIKNRVLMHMKETPSPEFHLSGDYEKIKADLQAQNQIQETSKSKIVVEHHQEHEKQLLEADRAIQEDIKTQVGIHVTIATEARQFFTEKVKRLEAEDKFHTQAIKEAIRDEFELRKPYLREVAEEYFTEQYKPKRQELDKEIHQYNTDLHKHNDRNLIYKFFKNQKYNEEAFELSRRVSNLQFRQKDLENVKIRDIDAAANGQYSLGIGDKTQEKINAIADEFARKQDPDFDRKMQECKERRAKHAAKSHEIYPELSKAQTINRGLQKLRSTERFELPVILRGKNKVQEIDWNALTAEEIRKRVKKELERPHNRDHDRGRSR